MSRESPANPPLPPDGSPPRGRNPRAAVHTAAAVVVFAAAGWFLLIQLAPLLRPLLVAVFLAYVLMPYHRRLSRRVGTPASIGVLAGVTAAALVGLAAAVYSSVVGLSDELPRLEQKLLAATHRANDVAAANAPWLGVGGDGKRLDERLAEQLTEVAGPLLNAAAAALVEAGVVGLYLLFLLLDAARLPDRVRRAYPPARADEILAVAGQVNAAIVSYLKAKVKTSLALAVPVGLVLWAFGVKFALLWAVLTFLCNFIPYLGSVVGYSLPVGFAFLWLDFGWQPAAVAAALLAWHLVCASVVEPTVLGKAVGLSPLVILGALAFWGLLWGIPGMFLAVPLTVVAVLVMKHLAVTRPLAELLSEG